MTESDARQGYDYVAQAEKSVLGAMLSSPAAIMTCVEIIEARDFHQPRYGQVFDAITRLAVRGEPADPITVAAELDRQGILQRIGGPAFLVDLYGSVLGVPADAPYYARIVADAATRRRYNDAGARIQQAASQPGVSGEEICQAALDLVNNPALRPIGEKADASILARYPPLDLHALLDPDRPEREWLWGSVIPAGTQVSLVGPAGTFKSLLAQSLALALAHGDTFFAGIPLAQNRKVLYLDRENSEDDLIDRFTNLGYQQNDLFDNLVYLPSWSPALPPLDTAEGGAELARLIDAYGLGEHDLVVLDSFQRVIEGPENDADTLRAFVRHTGEMLKARKLTVLRLDNTGKDVEKGSRGSSGKRDDVDIQFISTKLDEDEDGNIRIQVAPDKSRLGGIRSLTLTLRKDEDGEGIRWSSADDFMRSGVDACKWAMAEIGLEPGVSVRQAKTALRAAGRKLRNDTIQTAVREWKTEKQAVDNTARDAPAQCSQEISAESYIGLSDAIPQPVGYTQVHLDAELEEPVYPEAGVHPDTPTGELATNLALTSENSDEQVYPEAWVHPEHISDRANKADDCSRPHDHPVVGGRGQSASHARVQPAVQAQIGIRLCEVCGDPMTDLGDGRTTHPDCDPTGAGPP